MPTVNSADSLVFVLAGVGLLTTYGFLWHGAIVQTKSTRIGWTLTFMGALCRWGGLLLIGVGVVTTCLRILER